MAFLFSTALKKLAIINTDSLYVNYFFDPAFFIIPMTKIHKLDR